MVHSVQFNYMKAKSDLLRKGWSDERTSTLHNFKRSASVEDLGALILRNISIH